MHYQAAVASLLKLRHRIGQRKRYSARLQPLLRIFGHLRIERRHHLTGQLDDRYRDSTMDKVLCHLKADEAAAHDNRVLGFLLINPVSDLQAIGNSAQRKDSWQINPRPRRSDRRRARRQN